MKKATKKKQIEDLQTVVAAQWRQINKLKLVVGRLTEDWPDDDHEQADHDAVIDILDSKESKLKQLDQSVFDGLDEKWRFATMSNVGIPFVYDYKPTGKIAFLSDSSAQLMINVGKVMRINDSGYDTTDWQNSLIERKELTGSDLARAMLERGDKAVMCAVSDMSTSQAMSFGNYDLIHDCTNEHSFISSNQTWIYAVPINNQGEPLTAADVGL